MLKSIWKSSIPIMIALILVFNIVSCGVSTIDNQPDGTEIETTGETVEKTSVSVETTEESSTSDAEQAAFQDGPLVPYPETITITWGVAASAVDEFFDGDTYENNRWTRRFLEDLNINLEVAFSADAGTGSSGSSAYDERLRTMLVSGDLPDIFHSYDRLFFQEAHKAGYLMDLGPLLEQYGTDSVKQYSNDYLDSFEGGKIDGVQYGYPVMGDNFNTAHYIWIRDDWLENTNTQPPETVNEFIELARKFTFGNPNGDGSKTYGFAMTNSVVDNMVALLGAYGVPSAWGGIYYRGKDDKITNSLLQPEVKDVLGILRDMYNEGIIDPEFIVKDGAALESDITQNIVGMFDYRYWGNWYPYNFSYESEGVITRPYPIPKIENIDYKLGVSNNAGGMLQFLNANCKHPEAFIKILNLHNVVCNEYTDPHEYEYFISSHQDAFIPVRALIPTEHYAYMVHEALEKGSGDDLPLAVRPYYDYTVNFENKTDTSPPAYGTWGQMYERGSLKIAYEYINDGAFVEDIMGAQIPNAALENGEILKTMTNAAFTDIIVGDKPVDSFDFYIQDWLANGGQEILDDLEIFYPK